jgi:hypothetical protein
MLRLPHLRIINLERIIAIDVKIVSKNLIWRNPEFSVMRRREVVIDRGGRLVVEEETIFQCLDKDSPRLMPTSELGVSIEPRAYVWRTRVK